MAKNQLFDDKNYREYGKDYIKLIAKMLMRAGKDSSGKLIKSLSDNVQEDAQRVNLIIESENYFKYVDEGRKPGSFPPIKAIKDWAKINGIPQSAAFPIAKSIFKFGIKPTNIIEKSIKKFQPQLVKDIEEDVTDNVEEDVFNNIEKNFKDIK